MHTATFPLPRGITTSAPLQLQTGVALAVTVAVFYTGAFFGWLRQLLQA